MNTEANRSFLTGGIPPGGAQGYGGGQMQQPPGMPPPPQVGAGYFTQPARTRMPPPPAPQQFSPQQVQGGQHMPQMQDPYGLMRSGQPPRGGAYGPR